MLLRTIFSQLLLLTVIIVSFVGGAITFVLHNKTVDFTPLERYNPGEPTLLLDDKGNEWARFQLDRREPVSIEQIPDHVIQAFLSAEDHSFFEHSGISWRGIIRSVFVNLYHGRKKQGASTITQQLIRLLFFDAKKTFKRKLQEQFYALIAERQFTKNQILELYLNHVCFGLGIYGVEAASRRFWGCSVGDVSVEQAATLAGIVKAPTRLCPIVNPERSEKRRNIVLSSMKNRGFISAADYGRLCLLPLTVRTQDSNKMAPHLKETIRQFLEERFGKNTLYTGGLTVQTTLSARVQKSAQKSFSKKFQQLRTDIDPDVDGALISIDVKTGGIKALIGGVDFGVSKFNRALVARRQMGSIFKPIVYVAALESGKTFADTDIDEPFALEENQKFWMPKNVTNRFEGQITLARALAHSNNIVTIKTLMNVGCDKVACLGKKFRIPGIKSYPSIALGCVDATLKEAVGAFNVFANNGVYVEPHYLVWVKDRWGKKMYRSHPERERIISSRISGQVVKVLGIGMDRKRRLMPHQWLDCDGIGKTGTTNDCRSSWFSGSTPGLTTSIYVGIDDYRSMGARVYAVKTAFPIWLRLHKEITSQVKRFFYDPSLQEITIHSKTGQQSHRVSDPDVYTILV